jgi:hypothetical protein
MLFQVKYKLDDLAKGSFKEQAMGDGLWEKQTRGPVFAKASPRQARGHGDV